MTPGRYQPTCISLGCSVRVWSAKVANFLAEASRCQSCHIQEFVDGSGSEDLKRSSIRTVYLERNWLTHTCYSNDTEIHLVSSNRFRCFVGGCQCNEMPEGGPLFCSTSSLLLFNALSAVNLSDSSPEGAPPLFTRLVRFAFCFDFCFHLALSCQASASNQYLVWGRLTLSLAALSEPASSSIGAHNIALHFAVTGGMPHVCQLVQQQWQNALLRKVFHNFIPILTRGMSFNRGLRAQTRVFGSVKSCLWDHLRLQVMW